MAERPTIDEQANRAYQRFSSVGQPVGGIRNVVVETKKNQNPHQRRDGKGRVVSRTAKTTGGAMQAAGYVTQGLGKGTKAAGKGLARAGAALSSTGVGSIVGVPLAAVGAGATAAGAGIDRAGKVTRRTGKVIKQAGKKASIKSKAVNKGMSVAHMSVGFYIWGIFQLPFATISLVFFGVAAIFMEITGGVAEAFTEDPEGNPIVEGFKYLFRGATIIAKNAFDAFEQVSGLNISGIFSLPLDIFLISHFFLLGCMMAYVLFTSLTFLLSGKKMFSGRMGGVKIMAFILMTIGYATPILNLLPCFYPWVLLVNRYPK